MLSLRTGSLATVVALLSACGSASTPSTGSDGDQGTPSGSDNGNPTTSGAPGSSSSSTPTPSSSGTASAPPSGSLAGQLFGSHTQPYATGSIFPSGGQAALDQATSDFYDAWKAKYLIKDCGGYYVATTLDDNSGGGQSDNSITVSEAHGYGMLITAIMAGHDPAAQTIFDGLNAVFLAHPSINGAGLMAWEIDKGCVTDKGGDSATDGDIDIGYSLLLASKLWPGGATDYAAEAKTVMAAILAKEVNSDTHLTLLGDWSDSSDPQHYGTRPSDFMTDHFRAFGSFSSDPSWKATNDSIYTLVSTMQTAYATKTGLVPDFVVGTNTASPAPAPANYLEDVTDGDYAYNACRVPWRLGTDALIAGETRAKTALTPINAWMKNLTGGDATKIGTDYTLAGVSTTPDDRSMAFTAPFGVSAMIDASNQAWLDSIWTTVVAQSLTDEGDYFGNTVKLLSMIVMSGNWWAPY